MFVSTFCFHICFPSPIETNHIQAGLVSSHYPRVASLDHSCAQSDSQAFSLLFGPYKDKHLEVSDSLRILGVPMQYRYSSYTRTRRSSHIAWRVLYRSEEFNLKAIILISLSTSDTSTLLTFSSQITVPDAFSGCTSSFLTNFEEQSSQVSFRLARSLSRPLSHAAISTAES